MKRIIATIVLAFVAVFAGIGEEPLAKNESAKIRFAFADKEIVVSMVDNSAARSLVSMLPLTLKFEDFGGSEKISYPPRKLDITDVPSGYDPSAGDLTLYAPWGDLAFFYRDHGYASGLVPLGRIVTGSGFVRDLDSVGEVRVEAVD